MRGWPRGRVERVSLNEELDRAVEQALPPAVKFDIRVHRDFQPGLPMLLGQREHFTEVFVNILTNAREAMGGRGDLYLTTHTGPDFSVVIVLRDTGPAFPPRNFLSCFSCISPPRSGARGWAWPL